MSVREILLKLYWRLARIVTPGLMYSQTIYEDVLRQNVRQDFRWLDLGCGHSLLPPWRVQQEKELTGPCRGLVGIDADFASLRKHQTIRHRVCGDCARLPFKDAAFDLITSNMVVEHLSDPQAQFAEINRIVKPGGIFIFHTPNSRGYATLLTRIVPESIKPKLVELLQNRKEEDVYRTYYRVNTEHDIVRHSVAAGFEVESIRHICTSAIFQMIPPLLIFELLWIRLLLMRPFRKWRTNIITILRKPPA